MRDVGCARQRSARPVERAKASFDVYDAIALDESGAQVVARAIGHKLHLPFISDATLIAG